MTLGLAPEKLRTLRRQAAIYVSKRIARVNVAHALSLQLDAIRNQNLKRVWVNPTKANTMPECVESNNVSAEALRVNRTIRQGLCSDAPGTIVCFVIVGRALAVRMGDRRT